jgi:hypothetical protein
MAHTAAAAAAAGARRRLCLSTLGEMTVYYGAADTRIRWRNGSPLGTRGNSKLPYTLKLNSDKTLTGVRR